jgi:hypothetical protein
LGNQRVSHELLLEPHYQLTLERIGQSKTVFVIHDNEHQRGSCAIDVIDGQLSKCNAASCTERQEK